MGQSVDLGGLDLSVNDIKIGASSPGKVGNSMSVALSTTGTVTALSGTTTTAGGSIYASLEMGSADIGIFFGSGAPTITAPQGSIYLRTDGSSTSTRLYVNTNGGTTWTNVTTAT